MKNYKVIGLMSGTSLDGVDIVFCSFAEQDGKWFFDILKTKTVKYSKQWQQKLKSLDNTNAFEFVKTHVDYGHLLGEMVKDFISTEIIKPDFIASHGHTIFHQPEKNITSQIGDGAAIVAKTGLPVINDFRALDVALGGQGAPLVPIGDMLLFSKYNYCLNLGGFANISFSRNGKRVAFDICPANIILNLLSEKENREYDKDGEMASIGNINKTLLESLNNLDYYKLPHPKSLGKEWLNKFFIPVIDHHSLTIHDTLRTLCEHIAIQISKAIIDKETGNILVTGGGTYNKFLLKRIKENISLSIIIPENSIIDYKEALIFAFLGVLRLRGETNCLSSVTGAKNDNCGGIIHAL